LAQDLTARVHGEEAERRAAEASRVFFDRQNVATLRAASPTVWEMLAAEIPCWDTMRTTMPASVVDFIASAGLTESKGEARRQLRQGGIYVNGIRAGSDDTIDVEQLLANRYIWLRRGKKKDVIVRVT
jgi:tyrosyl-tRNA synthetase